MPDDPASLLSPIRERHHQHVSANYPDPGICASDHTRWPCDAARLLAAIDDVLILAADWGEPAFRHRITTALGGTQLSEDGDHD